MQKLLSIFMMLVLVVTTGFLPSLSHAMNHDVAKAEQSHANKDSDCHHGMHEKVSPDAAAKKDQDHSGRCCDKGMCKCIDGNCHGLSKIFGNGSSSLSAVTSRPLPFDFDKQFVDSGQPNRLKRPPRA